MSEDRNTLKARIELLVKKYGSWRKAARSMRISPSHLIRVHAGETGASDALLRRLGLKRNVSYTEIPQ